MIEILALLFALQTKHLVIDFYWQPPYEWQNKGTYGHWGGIRHSLKHVFGSIFALGLMFSILGLDIGLTTALTINLIEFMSHYHVDYWKMNTGAQAHEERFWHYLGLDQYLHQVTYLIMVAIIWINIF